MYPLLHSSSLAATLLFTVELLQAILPKGLHLEGLLTFTKGMFHFSMPNPKNVQEM